MKIVKIRRVGNSNVVTLPREYEVAGYTPGTDVVVDEAEGGELRIMPLTSLRRRLREPLGPGLEVSKPAQS